MISIPERLDPCPRKSKTQLVIRNIIEFPSFQSWRWILSGPAVLKDKRDGRHLFFFDRVYHGDNPGSRVLSLESFFMAMQTTRP
jgi:hypothetical protein